MLRFCRNLLHALLYSFSTDGRTSRQAFCDVSKGIGFLAVAAFLICVWRNTVAVMYVRDWLIISEVACWCLLILFEGFLISAMLTTAIRRWQDLDIIMPKDQTMVDLFKKGRFWEIISTTDGSNETNRFGPAPKENPVPPISEADMKESIRKQLFVDIHGIEEIK